MGTIADSQQDKNPRLIALKNHHQAAKRQRYLYVKRVFDLLICLSGLPVVLFLIVIFAIAIALDSSGSPIFTQERVGKDGRRFQLFKFRTMRHDYDDPEHRIFMQAFVIGQNILSANNPGNADHKPPIKRDITRVGRVLRKTSLDELPQIFNVLKGEMSLIGPRPNVTWEVEKYQDWHYERLKVLPGITGLAQVRGRSSITFDDIVKNDIEYIQKQCLKFDLQILWWTVRSVLGGKGAG